MFYLYEYECLSNDGESHTHTHTHAHTSIRVTEFIIFIHFVFVCVCFFYVGFFLLFFYDKIKWKKKLLKKTWDSMIMNQNKKVQNVKRKKSVIGKTIGDRQRRRPPPPTYDIRGIIHVKMGKKNFLFF